MSKEYTYLEAISEIFKNKSKRFTDNKTGEIMFFNKSMDTLNIKLDSANIIEELIINDNWIKSKWALVEEKKNYNVRVYNIDSGRLISSENKAMTEEEKNIYCENKVIWMLTIPIDPSVYYEELNYINSKVAITKVICEEIITT